jgi:hypothetical protein
MTVTMAQAYSLRMAVLIRPRMERLKHQPMLRMSGRLPIVLNRSKAALVNVLNPKPRYSNHLRQAIAKAANISSGNKLETNDDIPVPVPHGASNQLSTFLYPRYHLSTIGTFQGNSSRFYIAELCVPKSEITKHKCESRD